jgi:hypothetical protein
MTATVIGIALVAGATATAQGQAPQQNDSTTIPGPYRVWMSLGLGGAGGRYVDILNFHAAGSIAINRVVFSVGNNGMIYSERELTTYVVGVEARGPHQFETASIGLAKSVGNLGCHHCDGIVAMSGIHFAAFVVGIGLDAYAVLAQRGASAVGVSVALEAGWFGK